MFMRRMKLRPNLVGILLVLLWSASAVRPVNVFAKRISSSFQPIPGGHGCVNAAQDPRLDPFGLVCSLQRRFSYKSEHEPDLHIHANWAWGVSPPYLVYNQRLAGKQWRLMRIGWRYDRHWRGYIGPAAAWKTIPDPLLFY